MRVAVILNSVSRKKAGFFRYVYPALAQVATVDVWETRAQGHATALARQAAEEGFPCVLAAGGDGTLHQVLNGLHSGTQANLPTLGVIPLGTGNDFARLMNLELKKTNWAARLLAPPQHIDIGKIRFGDGLGNTRYFINACSVGLGPDVVHRLAGSSRRLGPALTYLLAILRTFFTNRPQQVSVVTNSMVWSGRLRVGAVANGRAFGNQIYIAPEASVTDGKLNVFIAGEFSLTELLKYLLQLKMGKIIRNERVYYGTARTVGLESIEPLWLEAEGELVCQLPADISLLAAAQPFLGVV